MKRIVVVEDDRWLGAHYMRVLTRAGFEPYLAADGAEAIDLIDTTVPDAIILDILLEQSTAPTLLHELQSHRDLSRIPVLLVSNIADRVDLGTMKRYGVHAVLDKATITPAQLVGEIQEVVA
ncbi:MAG TPA: response regulator [Candidatus Saccharimonadales bacterium]